MNDKKISMAVIRRLPRYYRYLGELLKKGTKRISSGELSEKMNVTASQIRQDLNNFGGFGQQGYGYNVEYLHSEIEKILGINKKYNLIIVGLGNLGQALANYANFEKRGFIVQAMFDSNPKIIGVEIKNKKVIDIKAIDEYIKNNKVDIAVLTLPSENAESVAKRLVNLNVKAFWNFSHVDLNMLGSDILVENVHLSDSLMTLSYRLNDK